MEFNKLYKGSTEKELEGVWVDFAEGVELRIARSGNPKFQEKLEQLLKPHRRKFRRGNIPLDLVRSLTQQAAIGTILVNWRGFTEKDENGKELPVNFSEDKALEYFKKSTDFVNDVLDFADDMELFREDDQEESGKN